MNIQPNLMNRNYNQPAFQAKFADDEQTQDVLKGFVVIGEHERANGPDYVYSLIKNLETLKSDDELSITREDCGDYTKKFTITNNRTRESVSMFEHITEFCAHKYHDEGCNISHNWEPGRVLYKTVIKNLDTLFDDTSRKPGTCFINPNYKPLNKEVNVSKINSKISALKKANSRMENKIENNENEISDLKKSVYAKKRDYVFNMIG